MDTLLTPFNAVLIVIAGIAAVVGAFIAIDKWQEYRTEALYKRKKLEDRDEDDRRIAKIVAESFTGRAEADHHFRAEALTNYKTVLREALDDHAKDERKYIDILRDKITEYHVESKTAIQDAKRIAMHVSSEYQAIKGRLIDIEQQLVLIKKDLEQHDHSNRRIEE